MDPSAQQGSRVPPDCIWCYELSRIENRGIQVETDAHVYIYIYIYVLIRVTHSIDPRGLLYLIHFIYYKLNLGASCWALRKHTAAFFFLIYIYIYIKKECHASWILALARTHARTHACTHARTQARKHTHTRAHTHAHEHTQKSVPRESAHANTHTRAPYTLPHTCTHAICTRTCTHPHMLPCTHTHVYPNTHKQTPTHRHVQPMSSHSLWHTHTHERLQLTDECRQQTNPARAARWGPMHQSPPTQIGSLPLEAPNRLLSSWGKFEFVTQYWVRESISSWWDNIEFGRKYWLCEMNSWWVL